MDCLLLTVSLRYVASDLGLHCLHMSAKKDAMLLCVKIEQSNSDAFFFKYFPGRVDNVHIINLLHSCGGFSLLLQSCENTEMCKS